MSTRAHYGKMRFCHMSFIWKTVILSIFFHNYPLGRPFQRQKFFFVTYVFSPKNFRIRLKKFCGTKYEKKSNKNTGWESRSTCMTRTLICAWNRLQSRICAPQGIPQLLCVCPPGRAPGGNTKHSGVHCVSSCFSSLLVLGPKFF